MCGRTCEGIVAVKPEAKSEDRIRVDFILKESSAGTGVKRMEFPGLVQMNECNCQN
jgi:hypothetical protein